MSTIKELPTVNFDAYPGYDEFKFLHSTYSEEFKERSAISSQWGIVDTGYDPATAPFTAGRPLLVTVSPVNSLTIDIAAGYAVTASHLLIDINAIVPSVPLPSLTSGKIYIVAVEYTLVASPQSRINRFGDLTEVRLERPANIPPGGGASTLINAITVADINDYNNPGIFSDERKQNVVVIAIVNALSDATTGQVYLSIDLTRNSYSFNRPWFTVRDVEHRTKIGSGVVTDNNPHGLDLQDLSTAGLTLYQQLKPRGGILAKDVSYYGYAGKICSEEITLSRWESDITGTMTNRPGFPNIGGRYYVRLSKLPVRTGSLYYAGKPWQPIPYEWIPGTRTVILGALENPANYSGSLMIEYFTVDALEINAESPTQGLQTLQVKTPASDQEIIVSAGLAINSLAQDTLALPSLLGPIKRGYQVLCDGRGALIVHPQPILASVNVVDLVGTTQTVNQAPLNGDAVYLTLGLTRAQERVSPTPSTVYDLDLKVQITGVDTNGTSRVEVLTFKGSQWKDQDPTLNQEEPLQFLRTMYKYQLVNSIALANTLSEPHNSGPYAIISLWADILSGANNQEFAPVASLFWTGTTGVNVRDERVIATSFDKLDQKQKRFPAELPDNNVTTVQELFSVLLNPPLTNPETPAKRLMLEMDDDRMWSETWKEFSSSWASGSITLNNIIYVTIGQTIRIAPGKYLRIVSGTANPAIGEVQYNTSDVIFRNNLIITINDPDWNSTWWSALGTGTNPPITLTREDAYPEGFVLNTRQKILFLGSFTGGSFSLDINGVTVGPVSYITDNLTTLAAIATAIDAAASLTGGITAVVDGTNGLILNGHPDGADFVLENLTSVSPAPGTALPPLSGAFTLSSPSGGKLETPHLPQRYPSALKPWVYLSRPFLWEGVGMQAEIKINGDDPAYIGDFDALEIAPAKIIFARVGTGATADPAIGQYLVDPDSLLITLTNLVATVNHPVFASGIGAEVAYDLIVEGTAPSITLGSSTLTDPAVDFISASVLPGEMLSIAGVMLPILTVATNDLTLDGTLPDSLTLVPYQVLRPIVRLHSAGMAVTILRLLAATIPATWVLTSVGGNTQYIPVGRGPQHAYLKALKPVDIAEWRFVTVENLALGWSGWMPMVRLSQNAFTLAAPVSEFLYQIQLKLQSQEVNAFALYDYIPEVSGASLAAVDARVTILENALAAATGTCVSLDARLSSVVDDAGAPIQDPELTETHESVILSDSTVLKDRLDIIDTRLYYASNGGISPHGVITTLGAGLPPQLLSGPVDINKNSDFVLVFGSSVFVGGSALYPLTAQINGYTYQFSRQIEFPFVGGITPVPTAGLYYVYLKEATAWGLGIVTGTVSAAAGATSVTVTEDLTLVKAGHLFTIPSVLVGGGQLTMPITSIVGQTLVLSGRLPSSVTSASYTIYNPREGTIGYESTKYVDDKTKLYLGEITWTGSALSAISYRYVNKFISAVEEVDAGGGSYTKTFNHNLGFIPPVFTLYFYEKSGGVPTGDPKVLHIGDEAVVKATKYTVTVRNRYANLVARTYDGTAKDVGYLQLMI